MGRVETTARRENSTKHISPGDEKSRDHAISQSNYRQLRARPPHGGRFLTNRARRSCVSSQQSSIHLGAALSPSKMAVEPCSISMETSHGGTPRLPRYLLNSRSCTAGLQVRLHSCPRLQAISPKWSNGLGRAGAADSGRAHLVGPHHQEAGTNVQCLFSSIEHPSLNSDRQKAVDTNRRASTDLWDWVMKNMKRRLQTKNWRKTGCLG